MSTQIKPKLPFLIEDCRGNEPARRSRKPLDSSGPLIDSLDRCCIDVLLIETFTLWNLQRMIGAFDCIERCRQAQLSNDVANLLLTPKCISRALHEQHR